jgi:hypothetical protein
MTTTYGDPTALASAPILVDQAPVEFLIAAVARQTTDGGADLAAKCGHDKCGCWPGQDH